MDMEVEEEKPALLTDMKPESKPDMVEEKTVEQVVQGFKAGTTISQLKYKQLCRALSQIRMWKDETKQEFLSGFLNLASVFDGSCIDLVRSLCDLDWMHIPSIQLPQFLKLLTDTCSYNPIFVDPVLKSCVRNLSPPIEFIADESGEVKACCPLSDSELELIYIKSMECIEIIVKRLPPAIFSLSSAILKHKPHRTAPLEKLVAHVRHIIVISDRFPQISEELYGALVNGLLQMDGIVSQYSGADIAKEASSLFLKTEVEATYDEEGYKVQIKEKLDVCMTILMCYVGLGTENPAIKPQDTPYTRFLESYEPNKVAFNRLLPILETHILNCHEMDNVPFLWFYMASYSRENLMKLMRVFWKVVITPSQRPNEFKKAHNSAAFMSGILARANFVNYQVMCFWLKQMANWCLHYIDKAGQVKRPGAHQHGTFYAVVQAFLFVLCFRYKEFVENKQIDELRLWGLGRIVHCQLEPLNYISTPLAKCFACVSRYMQIVYCNHIISLGENGPLEFYFPFLKSGLPRLSAIVQPLLREFTPADDDLATSAVVLAPRRRMESQTEIDEYDFMYADQPMEMTTDTSLLTTY
ncbi:unnamed protein product [Bursaphelenchus xylophilus]|uniref:(pine wood nematode) hypothetical protein n=1 Tax=Bursaphelenchus xylophilus TaxID=6326 RepID=A0A1I7RST3_BURXY|nr:unnamed protein product [Bursaphelenchus xylophilus]CAG9122810.1 unnamed protein product [Bursaphelenchus xylophilus]